MLYREDTMTVQVMEELGKSKQQAAHKFEISLSHDSMVQFRRSHIISAESEDVLRYLSRGYWRSNVAHHKEVYRQQSASHACMVLMEYRANVE